MICTYAGGACEKEALYISRNNKGIAYLCREHFSHLGALGLLGEVTVIGDKPE